MLACYVFVGNLQVMIHFLLHEWQTFWSCVRCSSMGINFLLQSKVFVLIMDLTFHFYVVWNVSTFHFGAIVQFLCDHRSVIAHGDTLEVEPVSTSI